ncbi:MAG: hypothetical protein JWM86_525 [Thermoleophilia bacterium]|nr:hypothetical protein [Thermoleophilia bacterium]
MELRLALLAARLLDPRKWRLRLAQLGGGLLGSLWIWYRAVDHADVDRAVRDARHAERRARITARNLELERGYLRGDESGVSGS